VGRFKSRKSESFGLAEAIAFERELLAEVVEAGKFLVVLVIAVEVRDDAPVVEGNGFGAEVFVGPLATGLDCHENDILYENDDDMSKSIYCTHCYPQKTPKTT